RIRLAAAAAALLLLLPANDSTEERLWRFRNLGKAFYENPTTQAEAVVEFKKALDLEPNGKREQVNYALALLRAGKTKEGVEALEAVQKRFPDLPHTWFNLGIVYKKDGDFDKAQVQFERMIQLAPDEPVSHYNLGVLYKQAGRAQDAVTQFQTAVGLNGNLAAPHFQLYNVYRSLGRKDEAATELATFQQLKKAQEGSATPEDMEWSEYAEIYDPMDVKPDVLAAPVYEGIPVSGEHVVAIDADGDGVVDAIVWSSGKAELYKSGKTLVAKSGFTGLTGILSIAPGDYDNDGWMDLAVVTRGGVRLLHNKKGVFEPVELPAAKGEFRSAVWIDFDHDYDSDLMLLGDKSVLLRNQGTAGFVDRTADFPFVAGKALSGAQFRQVADTKGFDLVVSYADRAGVLYHDLLAGKYEARDLAEMPAGSTIRAIADVNRDSFLDIVLDKGQVLINRMGKSFEASTQAAVLDSEIVLRNGRLESRRAPANWIRVGLLGVKNMKLAEGAEVEVKTGTLYQKRVYPGYPILFDLGGRAMADTVRITWPNGLIQNEMKQPGGKAYTYKEAQRLSGSCPMIWTWNGSGFQFVTDVLGVAPLGAMSGDGSFFPVDHDEYIQIPGDALQRNAEGNYEVRITEELSEVSYLDQVHLIAVDHPADVAIYTSEKWKGPPFPEFRLFGVSKRIDPVAARDQSGRDVRARVLKQDFTYPDTFKRTESGIAELHTLDLDFGSAAAKDNRGVLMLHGWVDWADGSTFLAAAQESKEGLIPPYLQVKDASGNWVTAIADMGMPDGKPKTIAVDLTGKFLTANREVRIVTNMCVYWDEIFLSDSSAAPQVTQTRVPTLTADVRFRGFSASKIHPERKQPETFYYEPHSELTYWNPTPNGKYTRYGPVLKLVESADDQFVIMGAGDELRLQFNAAALPAVENGFRRDYLLKVDGWAKDRDANTAHSQSVEPLPFHGMSSYPYPASEHYPDTPETRAYRTFYNTRPGLRLIRPLVGDKTREPVRVKSGMGN
ncbi:MAG TPA: tetratricopeptide repeat protein, partial [Bryobacteraceae bacterium]